VVVVSLTLRSVFFRSLCGSGFTDTAQRDLLEVCVVVVSLTLRSVNFTTFRKAQRQFS
jgi:hypothetical protein